MPVIHFRGRKIPAARGTKLKDALASGGVSSHNGAARVLNCHGLGSCGTCAVSVQGPLSPPGMRETLRLRLPPHDPKSGLRLACQARIEGDLQVEKWGGFWGQRRSSAR